MRPWFESRRSNGQQASIDIFDDIGGFGLQMNDFAKAIKGLGEFDRLVININSGGGEVFTGLGIYNILKGISAQKLVRIQGLAASIASVIAMAGDVIEIPENGFVMIHDPSALVAGRAEDMDKMSETLKGIRRSLVGIYHKRTGLSEKEIEDMMAAETWMDGREAVARGFATYLIETPAIAASVNLSKYHRVPAPVSRAFTSATESRMSDTIENTASAADATPEVDNEKVHRDRRQKIEEIAAREEKKLRAEAEKYRQKTVQHDVKQQSEEEIARKIRARDQMIKDVYKSATMLNLTSEAAELLDEGIDPAQIPAMLIEISARREKQRAAIGNMIPSGASVGFSYEDPKVVLANMADAITASVVPSYKAPDAAREYMNWRPMGFMRAALEMRGTDTRRMQPADIVNAAMTTSDFPQLLGSSANKIFLGAYDAAPSTYRMIAARRDVPNFQVQDLMRPGDFPALAFLPEGGEIKAGAMSEAKEQAQLKTFARMIQLSRQALVNDSLGAFGDLAAKAGVAAAQLENLTVWTTITSNAGMGPTLADGVALFNTASHGNYYAHANAVLSAAAIGTGRGSMRVQKSLDGNALNVTPAILVVPAALETVAEQVLNPLVVPTTATGSLTPSMRTLEVVVEPLLDSATDGTTAWYLFASPALRSGAVVYGGLEGNTGPRVVVDNPFHVDGIQMRVVHDFYAAVADYRFVWKSKGAP